MFRSDPKAHWAIYKNETEGDSGYPWFVEHRLVPEGHPRHEHDADDTHEYGSFRTFTEAVAAMRQWSIDECVFVPTYKDHGYDPDGDLRLEQMEYHDAWRDLYPVNYGDPEDPKVAFVWATSVSVALAILSDWVRQH